MGKKTIHIYLEHIGRGEGAFDDMRIAAVTAIKNGGPDPALTGKDWSRFTVSITTRI
jgi:hypothetical protein